MPLLAGKGLCDDSNPCRRYGSRCPRCAAQDGLTAEDWTLVEFYRRVEDQFVNQQPMGGAPNTPPLLTLRLEALESALRIYGYPRELWPWLTDWARSLHRLVRGMEKPALTDDRKAHFRSLGVEC